MSGLRILVIDDSLTIRKLIEIALRGSEHNVEYAATGQLGVARASELAPDLVLCDYVLPDLRGHEVCRAITADPRCRRTALVVITGKQDQVRPLFAGITVTEFLNKPFTAEAVKAVVASVAQRRQPAFAVTRDTALALASSFRAALYDVLCERLARIPAWSGELGAEQPATFFARKLFTESVLAELFEALLPIYQQTRPRAHDPNLVAEGSLALLRPARLVELALRQGGTSELTFQTERGTTVYFATAGRLYTSNRGSVPSTSPAALAAALRGHDGRFAWRRLELVPPEVVGEPVHVLQLQLECARLHDDLPLLAAQEVLVRPTGFSARVRDLAFTAEEQRVVTLIDGASSAGDIVRRAGGTPATTQLVIARLVEIGLVRPRSADGGSTDAAPQLLVVVEPDEDGVLTPLARHFGSRAPATGLLALDGSGGVDALLRPQPTAILINATTHRELALSAGAAAAGVATHPRVVAMLDDADGSEPALRAAGIAAVLIKPIHLLDLATALVEPPTTGSSQSPPV